MLGSWGGGLPKGSALPGSSSAVGRRQGEERDGPAAGTLGQAGLLNSSALPLHPKMGHIPRRRRRKDPSRSPCFLGLFWGEVGKDGKRRRSVPMTGLDWILQNGKRLSAWSAPGTWPLLGSAWFPLGLPRVT